MPSVRVLPPLVALHVRNMVLFIRSFPTSVTRSRVYFFIGYTLATFSVFPPNVIIHHPSSPSSPDYVVSFFAIIRYIRASSYTTRGVRFAIVLQDLSRAL